ncbi:Uncharacterised protein [uncultured archaeon]|nr:Uncharacterised protein [uncultured archaeon]
MGKRKAAFLFTAAVAFLFLLGLVFAQLGTLPDALSTLCNALTNLLPVVGMFMILVAAVVYALGQIMGAETRARGNVWATAALGGALMAFLIVTVAPPILSALFGGAINCGVAPLPPPVQCQTPPPPPIQVWQCPPGSTCGPMPGQCF